MSWFDLVIVDGQKPRFFSSGTPLLRLDKQTLEKVPLDSVDNPNTGQLVYSGGDHRTITNMLGKNLYRIVCCKHYCRKQENKNSVYI